MSAERALIWLTLALLLACGGFLALGLGPVWGFALQLRAEKLAALLCVGAAVSVSAVLLQTLTSNRILTPSIMGYDALYVLLQSLIIAGLGPEVFVAAPAVPRFLAETAAMLAASALLFSILGGGERRDLHKLVLTGLILGVLFRSLSAMAARIVDPTAFALLQNASFASFNRIDAALLPVAIPVCVAALALAWGLGPRLDVMALGRAPATALGLRYDRLTHAALALMAVLVSVSTALAGPMAFLGLIAAALAHAWAGATHRRLLPAAALIGALVLVAGQTLFERVLGMESALAIVVETVGGLIFLALIFRGALR